jgi:hypothetical protein
MKPGVSRPSLVVFTDRKSSLGAQRPASLEKIVWFFGEGIPAAEIQSANAPEKPKPEKTSRFWR